MQDIDRYLRALEARRCTWSDPRVGHDIYYDDAVLNYPQSMDGG